MQNITNTYFDRICKEKFLINAYRDMEKEYTDSNGVKKSKFNSKKDEKCDIILRYY